MPSLFFLASFLLGFVYANLPDEDLSHVNFVLAGIRHGNRNPETFIPNDPNEGKWGLEGSLQLTNAGKRQGYAMGRALRSRYPHLLSEHHSSDEMKAISSSASRAQMTMQTLLAGLYPPVGRSVWHPNFTNWQPIYIQTNNPIVRMYNVDCPSYDTAWEAIDTEVMPHLAKTLQDEKEFIDYVVKNTQWEPTLSAMADLTDNIINLEMNGLEMPEWIKDPSEIGLTEEEMLEKIHSLAEIRQIACANHAPCRNILGGHWLSNVVDLLSQKAEGKKEDLKMVAYLGHTETTLSVMRMMDITEEKLETSGGWILEMGVDDFGRDAIRLLVTQPVEGNPDEREIRLAELSEPCLVGDVAADWCPVDLFLSKMRRRALPDWEAACTSIDSGVCGPGQKYMSCGAPASCESTCADRSPKPCIRRRMCNQPGCFCEAGYFRKGMDCLKADECPAVPGPFGRLLLTIRAIIVGRPYN